MYFGTCEVCDKPVDTSATDVRLRQPAFPVKGWEVPREGGGTNHIRNRERIPGRVRHVACLPIADGQESLL